MERVGGCLYLRVCEGYQADFKLIKSCSRLYDEKEVVYTWVTYEDTVLPVLKIAYKKFNYFYVDIKNDLIAHDICKNRLGSMMTIPGSQLLITNHVIQSGDETTVLKAYIEDSWLEREFSNQWSKPVITRWYHEHLRPHHIIRSYIKARGTTLVIRSYIDLVTYLLRISEGVERPFVTTLLAYVSSLEEREAHLFIVALLEQKLDNSVEIGQWLKDTSATYKQYAMSHQVPTPHKFFELNVLINRTEGDLDWDKEIRNRTHAETVDIPVNYVYKKAKQIFSDVPSEYKYATMIGINL